MLPRACGASASRTAAGRRVQSRPRLSAGMGVRDYAQSTYQEFPYEESSSRTFPETPYNIIRT